MATLMQTLLEFYKGSSLVVNLLGAECERLYAMHSPEGESRLRCEYRISATSRGHQLTGTIGLATSIVTFDCISDTSPEASDQLADAMMYGDVGNPPLTRFQGNGYGVNIRSVQISGGPDHSLEGVNPGTEQYRYVTTFQLRIDYETPWP